MNLCTLWGRYKRIVILILTLILCVFIASKLGINFNPVISAFLTSTGEFNWTSITAIAAVVAIFMTSTINLKGIKANLVSKSRLEWVAKTKEELNLFIDNCSKLLAEHDKIYLEMESIFNDQRSTQLKNRREDYLTDYKRVFKDIKNTEVENALKSNLEGGYSRYQSFETAIKDKYDIPDTKSGLSSDTLRYEYKKMFVNFNYKFHLHKDILNYSRADNRRQSVKLSDRRNQLKQELEGLIVSMPNYQKKLDEYYQLRSQLEHEIEHSYVRMLLELSSNTDNDNFIYKLSLLKNHCLKDRIMLSLIDKHEKEIYSLQAKFYVAFLIEDAREYFKKEWEKVKIGK
ncbi:hypothetical protein HCC45_05205 [Streptococcus suis]|nr:hypothetical protein [Streptococcus suis]